MEDKNSLHLLANPQYHKKKTIKLNTIDDHLLILLQKGVFWRCAFERILRESQEDPQEHLKRIFRGPQEGWKTELRGTK